MKILVVCFLGCAVVVLVGAAAAQEEKAQNDQTASNDLIKRYFVCPRGWTMIYGGCYIYVPLARTWGRAERNCRSMGGHLASVRSLKEYRAIEKMIAVTTSYDKTAWLGASNAKHPNVWRWSNGEAFIFSYWCRGEPNHGHGRQHCLQMNYSVVDRKCWDDLQCNAHRPSVCAKNRRRD
ncbi:ladderlectin-like [Channa argus]|uniref:ladderlectin-like n=1 Tax=Channa argus TaxID=215402 RepID=UPI003522D48D